MKKFFRMALVLALAGGTLLYTSCTKDYSEEVNNLEKQVTANETTIKSLQDQVSTLTAAKTALEQATKAAEKEIETLKSTISSLTSKATGLETDVEALKTRIATLESTVASNKTAIAALETALAAKADKSYVDSELAKKADKSWVTETLANYALASDVQTAVGNLQAAIDGVSGAITALQGVVADKADKSEVEALVADLGTLKTNLTPVTTRLGEVEEKATTALTEIGAIKTALEQKADLTYVDAIKGDVTTLKSQMTAVERAVADLIANVYTKTEVDSALEALKAALQNEISASKTAAANEIKGLTTDVNKLIARIQSVEYVPDYNDGKITVAYGELEGSFNGGADVTAANVTTSSEVFDFDLRNEKVTADVFDKAYAYAIDPANANVAATDAKNLWAALNKVTSGVAVNGVANKYVMVPNVATYRFFGVDAQNTAEAIAQVWAKDPAILSYHVVSVKDAATRADATPVAGLKITGVKAVTGDVPGLIEITFLPENMPQKFFDNNDFFSASLVLSEVNDTTSRAITSDYDQLAATTGAKAVELAIFKGDKEVTDFFGTTLNPTFANSAATQKFADTVKIQYIDTKEKTLFKDFELKFKFNGKKYTADDLGLEVGAPVKKFWYRVDTTQAVGPAAEIPAKTVSPVFTVGDDLTVKLADVYPASVKTQAYAQLVYFVGNTAVGTGAYVEVTPVEVELDLGVIGNFTWEYEKDASIDSAIFQGADTVYVREVKDLLANLTEAEKKAIADANIDLSDLSHKTPDSTQVTAGKFGTAAEVTKGAKRATSADPAPGLDIIKATVAKTRFNLVPSIVSGKLNANVLFNFQTRDDYKFYAEYNYPTVDKPSVTLKIKGEVKTTDRGRDTIKVTLPEYVAEMYVPTYNYADDVRDAYDSLYTDVVTSALPADFVTNGIKTNAIVLDAFGKLDDAGYNTANNANTQSGKVYVWTRPDVYADWTEANSGTGVYRPTVDTTTVNDAILAFDSKFRIDYGWQDNVEVSPEQRLENVVTLWYGQPVLFTKVVKFNNDGAYDFERIPEYVPTNSKDYIDYSAQVQPKWTIDELGNVDNTTPSAAALNYNTKVYAFQTSKVRLDQLFRVVKGSGANREVITEVAPDKLGQLKGAYADTLDRYFVLLDKNGKQVSEIADIRPFATDAFFGWQAPTDTIGIYVDRDTLSYVAANPDVHVAGVLNYKFGAAHNNRMPIATTFERKGANGEIYDKFYVTKYDPIGEFTVTSGEEVRKINNAIVDRLSIYDFMTLKDIRGRNLIVANPSSAASPWVVGNASTSSSNNGFANGRRVDEVYNLVVKNSCTFDTAMSPEVQARFDFDEATGVLTYDNTVQATLAAPVKCTLKVSIQYPWGQTEEKSKVVVYTTEGVNY